MPTQNGPSRAKTPGRLAAPVALRSRGDSASQAPVRGSYRQGLDGLLCTVRDHQGLFGMQLGEQSTEKGQRKTSEIGSRARNSASEFSRELPMEKADKRRCVLEGEVVSGVVRCAMLWEVRACQS